MCNFVALRTGLTMPRSRRIAAFWGVLLFSATFGHAAGEVANANIFLDDGADYSEASELPVSARTTSRTKLFERKRNECLGLMLSISRKCKRTVNRKAQNDQCTTENECQDLYSSCHDRLRRRHFIQERSCQRVTRGRVPLCEAETRFIAVQTNPQEPKFDERQLRIFERLANITDPGLLSDPETPQGQAFNWIAREDELELDVNKVTLDQRYILATFYFATNGDGWDRYYRHSKEEYFSFINFRGREEEYNFCVTSDGRVDAHLQLEYCRDEYTRGTREQWRLSDGGLLRVVSDYDEQDLCAGVSIQKDGQPVQFLHCDEASGDQRWVYNNRSNDEISLLNTDLCMTVIPRYLNVFRRGDPIVLSPCNATLDQVLTYKSGLSRPFLSPSPECSWGGVAMCTDDDFVLEISLVNKNLIGKLPNEFGHLQYLDRLRLSSNHLAGQINPHSFPESLSALHLGQNSYIGDIPRLELPLLKQLDISENKISGGLDALFQSLPKNISEVRLNNNRLKEEVPVVLSDFTSLTYLDMSTNFLNGTVPEVLCNLSDFRVHVSQHEDNCPREVTCSCCRFTPCPTPEPTFAPTTSQPPSISLAPTVDLQEIYSVLANITDTTTLDDSTTPQGRALHWLLRGDERHLQPDDPTLTQRYVMAVLYFSTNGDKWSKCSAEAPPEECGFSSYYRDNYQPFLSQASECVWGHWLANACDRDGHITTIRIPNNNLAGPLPPELAALPELRRIDLSQNKLSGGLLDAWPKLDRLLLSENHLSGTVGGNFPRRLSQLHLDNNMLNGSLDELASGLIQSRVYHLSLQSNAFIGTISPKFSKMRLRYVAFEDNKVTGTMPEGICGKKTRVSADCPPDGVSCSCCRCPPTPRPTAMPTISNKPSISALPSHMPTVSAMPSVSAAPTNAPTRLPTKAPIPSQASVSYTDSYMGNPRHSFSASFSGPVRRRLSRVEDGNRDALRKKHLAKRRYYA